MKKIIFCLFVLGMISCSSSDSDRSVEPICKLGTYRECTFGSTIGECKRGKQFCWGDRWDACLGEIRPVLEVCDGLDNDCDGWIDEEVTNSCGECAFQPIEICNGLDDDCDGNIDEGFENNEEICDGIDNNCNGRVDEGLSKRRDCLPIGAEGDWIHFEEPSLCKMGWQECRDGRWFGLTEECEDFIPPSPEICNGFDDDCDGEVDELQEETQCGVSDVGACRFGHEICSGSEIYCIGDIEPQAEICDGIDNNCNGQTDEELFRPCSTICNQGIEVCVRGQWVGCTAKQPLPEICNGEDDDCNGEADDGINCSCDFGASQICPLEECGWGVKFCDENGFWSECNGLVERDEDCNGFDDNCNGQADEGLSLDCYTGPPNSSGIGICSSGQSVCINGEWSECQNQVLPQTEICDGIDNDCDGELDNLIRTFEKVDMVFVLDVSSSMSVYIDGLKEGIEQYVTHLQGNNHRFGIVVFGHDGIDSQFGRGYPYVHVYLGELEDFLWNLGSLNTQGSVEPSIDAVYDVANPQNRLGLNWREDATPIIVLVGDEPAASNRELQLQSMLPFTVQCHLPGCNNTTNENWENGDPLEIFAFIWLTRFETWSEVVREDHLFDIESTRNGTLGVNLRLLFSEVCLD